MIFKKLNFLDIRIANNLKQSYDFAIYRKPAITNVQIKSLANIFPNIIMGVFQEILSQALHICSQKYLGQEIKILINVFAENIRYSFIITVILQFQKKSSKNI